MKPSTARHAGPQPRRSPRSTGIAALLLALAATLPSADAGRPANSRTASERADAPPRPEVQAIPWVDNPAAASRTWTAALGSPETLEFEVSFGLLGHSGDLTVSLRPGDTPETRGLLLVETSSRTRNLARLLYRYDATGTSVVDPASARVLRSTFNGSGRRDERVVETLFDYQGSSLSVRQSKPEVEFREIAFPEGGARLDATSALVEFRRLPLAEGAHLPVRLFAGDRFLDLVVVVGPREPRDTALGTIDAFRVEPTMPADPSSFWKRGGRAFLWISDDDRRLPVEMEVRTKNGTARARLVRYEAAPPAVPPPPASAP